MIVRNPTPGEVERAAEVSLLAFQNLTLEQWLKYYRKIVEEFSERYILVVEEDGQIVSSLFCTPGPVYIGGKPVSHSAVGAVGTIPEYRKHGCAGAMMEECVRMLREEKICLSSLWPFSYEYYRKFGWEVGAEVRKYSTSGNNYEPLGDPERCRGVRIDDLDDMKIAYNFYSPKYNCLTDRSDKWWESLVYLLDNLQYGLESGNQTVVHMTDGRVDGYAVFSHDKADDKTFIDMREIVYKHEAHRRNLLAFLGKGNPDAQITFNAPYGDTFLHEMPNPRTFITNVEPSFQFRIIDPVNAILNVNPPECISGRLTLAISDPVFSEGFEFGIEIEDGYVSLTKPDKTNRLDMSIQTLSKIYSGYLTISNALRLGMLSNTGVSKDTINTASHLFSANTPYRSWLEPG